MLVNIETGNTKECFDNICKELENNKEPKHNNCVIDMTSNVKFLGNYVTVQGEEPEAFQIYDLFVSETSKFLGRKKIFIAQYGENPTDYVSAFEDELYNQDNKELKKQAVGEAYRRYKNRTFVMGYYPELDLIKT